MREQYKNHIPPQGQKIRHGLTQGKTDEDEEKTRRKTNSLLFSMDIGEVEETWIFLPSQRALTICPGCWMKGVMTKTHERRTLQNGGAKKASLSPRAFDGLIGKQSTIRGKWVHAYSDYGRVVFYSASSP
ncbi:MAG: hypothetical protein OXG62_15975 [Nitrospinae bacterium]|nr:hypothetical protein [Nitrospinota bacterium]